MPSETPGRGGPAGLGTPASEGRGRTSAPPASAGRTGHNPAVLDADVDRPGRRRRGPLHAILVLLLLIGHGPDARAQVTTTGNIRVSVADQAGLPVPGAAVTAAADDAPTTRVGFTDAAGLAELRALTPSARYTVTVELTGFRTSRRADLLVRAGQTASLAVRLAATGSTTSTSATPRATRPAWPPRPAGTRYTAAWSSCGTRTFATPRTTGGCTRRWRGRWRGSRPASSSRAASPTRASTRPTAATTTGFIRTVDGLPDRAAFYALYDLAPTVGRGRTQPATLGAPRAARRGRRLHPARATPGRKPWRRYRRRGGPLPRSDAAGRRERTAPAEVARFRGKAVGWSPKSEHTEG